MKPLRRLSSTVLSSFDAVINQLENHEALVASAIQDAERTTLRARDHLEQVKRDGLALRKHSIDLKDQALTWEDRAVKCAALDESKALECLRRRQALLKSHGRLEEQAQHYTNLERNLHRDLATLQQKLTNLRQQRTLLRTRESRAQVLQALQSVDAATVNEIDDIFDRWESRVASTEHQAHTIHTAITDDLATQFESAEETQELRQLLATLITKNK
jgi:phage shock protein A